MVLLNRQGLGAIAQFMRGWLSTKPYIILFKRPLHETAPLLEAYHQTEKKQRMAMK